MAKTPGGPTIGIRGGSGGISSGGFSGGSTPEENARFMQKIQDALAKQVAEENKAAESMSKAADKMESAADKISENESNNNKKFEQIGDSLKDKFNSFEKSIDSFAESIQSNSRPNTTPTGSNASRSNKIDIIDEKLTSLLQVNKELLDAADAHGEVFYRILEAVMDMGKGGGGGGAKPPRPPGPAAAPTGGSPRGPSPRGGGGGGGILGGLGSLAGGLGGGLGAAMGGLGALLVGGGLGGLLFSATDAKAVKSNVETLLSIGDGYENKTDFLKAGGSLFLALSGIGAGLAVFGAGQAAVGLAQFTTDSKWTETLKTNVESLLSLSDSLGGNWELLKSGGAFGLAMAGIGAGLGVFAAGQAAEAAAQFTTSADWAKKIVDNVTTLLSIADLKNVGWNTATFIGVMGGISAGLLAFTVAQGANAAVEAVSKAIDYFTGDKPFANRIVEQVKTLLSIADLPLADTVKFIATMGGISAGLVAFTVAQGANVAVDSVSKAIDYFTGEQPFADRIYNQVAKLLSITNIDYGDGKSFAGVMGDIVTGLTAFTEGNFVDTLLSVGTRLVGFFSGKESPIERVLQLADNADKLEKGADALMKIAQALNEFSNIKVNALSDIDFEGMAKNLGKAIPFLDALANGGHVKGSEGWFTSGIDFPKGILDPSLRLDEMVAAISKVNQALGATSTVTSKSSTGETEVTEASPSITAAAPTVGNQNEFLTLDAAGIKLEKQGQAPIIINAQQLGGNAPSMGFESGTGKIGGVINTQPSQSHIDRSLYGWDSLHAVTP